jgi:AraC family transcriptional regulator
MAEPPYEARILRVINYLWANLDAPLDLDRLAEVACFSPYHFHRLYRGITGETVAETVRRLRLHRAAGALLASDRPITAIAATAGYGGQAAFTRAFAAHYGAAPGFYRQSAASPARLEETMVPVEILHLPAQTCLALAHVGPEQHIDKAFETLALHAAPRGLMTEAARFFAVYYDDPTRVPAEALRAHACLTVPRETLAEPPLENLTLGGQRYAVARFVGPYAELERAYHWLYSTWFPTQGIEPGDAPCLEEYLNDPKQVPPADLETLIYIPLAEEGARE